ncbi:MAG: hypothetical protein ACM3O7_05030 [Acidobacteriota bacterium]
MREAGPPSERIALLAFIAEALKKHLERDSGLAAACAGLQRAGYAVVVHVEPAPGDRAPRVVVEPTMSAVPQWTTEDRELLRSLGIADDLDEPTQPSSKPGRRQPR